jgi:hypothetical protein
MEGERMSDDYLATLARRFADAGYMVTQNVPFRMYQFRVVARKTRFTANMVFAEEWFVAAEFPSIDRAGLEAYALAVAEYAWENRLRKPFLARFLGLQLRIFPIAIAAEFSKDAEEFFATGTPLYGPPALRVPVGLQTRRGSLHHFTPGWSTRILKQSIDKFLLPQAGSATG